MSDLSKNIGICYFVSKANSLIHETTKVFYRFRSEYPVDEGLLNRCAILSAAYYFRRKGACPTLAVLEDLGMGPKELEEVQIYFDRFSDEPLCCFYDYSSEVEKLISESARSRGALSLVFIPQFQGKRREIEEYLTLPKAIESGSKTQKN